MANAGFSTQTTHDYLGCAGAKLKCVSSEQGLALETAEAVNCSGDLAALDTHNASTAPSCEYALAADLELADLRAIAPGTVRAAVSPNTQPTAIETVRIHTAAGEAPTVTVTGRGVEAGASGNMGSVSDFPASCAVSKLHKAQDFGQFSWTGGGNLVSCDLEVSSRVTPVHAGGSCIASGIAHLGATIEGEITCPAGAAPAITASGWTVTQPPTLTSSDGGYDTYSFALRKTAALQTLSP